MMLHRYTHGHSILVGALIGLLLDRHTFVVACAAFAAGIVLGRAWQAIVRVVARVAPYPRPTMRRKVTQ
jgi:phytoene/squalene synthetase